MESITINEQTQGMSLEQEALQQQQQQQPQQDLILGKFKSYDELAEAYKNLEKKLGSQQPAQTQPRMIETPEQAQEIVAKAGLDFNKYDQEFMQYGYLSEQSLEELAKAGIPKETVDYYIQGQKALAEKMLNDIYTNLGGQDVFQEVMGWASENLSEQEIDTFNKIVETGNLDMIKLALKGIQAKYLENNNTLISKNTFINNNTSLSPFRSWQEVSEAMSDRRYGKDPAYTKDVERRIAMSKL